MVLKKLPVAEWKCTVMVKSSLTPALLSTWICDKTWSLMYLYNCVFVYLFKHKSTMYIIYSFWYTRYILFWVTEEQIMNETILLSLTVQDWSAVPYLSSTEQQVEWGLLSATGSRQTEVVQRVAGDQSATGYCTVEVNGSGIELYGQRAWMGDAQNSVQEMCCLAGTLQI